MNVICVSKAAKAAGQLGRGLRQDLSGSQKLASSMLLKFKEKKALVADALFESLCQMFEAGCFYLSDIADDLSSAVTNKVNGLTAVHTLTGSRCPKCVLVL